MKEFFIRYNRDGFTLSTTASMLMMTFALGICRKPSIQTTIERLILPEKIQPIDLLELHDLDQMDADAFQSYRAYIQQCNSQQYNRAKTVLWDSLIQSGLVKRV